MADQATTVQTPAQNEPVYVSDATFAQSLASAGNMPVLVDFYAEWCGPCKMIAPVLQEMAKDMAGKALITKVNVDENQQTAREFGVMSIPTLIVFKDGKPVDKVVGFSSKEKLSEMLTKHM